MLALTLVAPAHTVAVRPAHADAPTGQMTWALHFTLAPTLFEPAETPGLITPFLILYALHDGLVKPMPDRTMAPSLAESWSMAADGRVYEFVLRRGARFHNAEPDTTTRLAMLKRGEVDIAYAITGELGEEVRRTPGLTLKPTPFVATHWLLFADQWDPGSPWHDRRVRLAANHAVNRQAMNQALTLGFSKITGSIIPTSSGYYWQPPLYPYDPGEATQLLAEAGYPKGFDAGDFWCDAGACVYAEIGRAHV